MNFDLTDEQRMLQSAAKDMLAARLNSDKIRALAESDDALDEKLWSEIVDLGWPGLVVSEEYGGQGLGMVELVVLMEQVGYALLPGPFLSNTLAAIVLEHGAGEELKQRYLAPLAGGEKRGTLAYWDEGHGATPDQIVLDPELSGDSYTLEAEKLFVLDADRADFFIVGAAHGRRFVVDGEAPGVAVTPIPALDATRKQYALRLDGVQVDEAAAFEFDGSNLARTWSRLITVFAAESVGIAQRAMEMAVTYAKERKQFDRPIGAYQAVSHACARMLLETEGARSAAYYAAWVADNEPEDAPLASAMAKAYASDAACDVTGSSLQVHGGIGFTWEHDLHLWLKRARTNAALFGGSRYQREVVARLAIDGSRKTEPALA
ncbi:MAG: acyl-CoA dehydrogenase family protein [Solirubrobacterales bacterium]